MSDLFGATAQPQKADPRDKHCAGCGSPNAHCGDAGQWWCAACVHPSYWPQNRGEG